MGKIIKKNVVKREKGYLTGDDNPSKRPEVIEKIRQKAIERYKNPEYKEKHKLATQEYYKYNEHHTKGIPKPKEQKDKMSVTRKQWYINNPEKAIKKNDKSIITNILSNNQGSLKHKRFNTSSICNRYSIC